MVEMILRLIILVTKQQMTLCVLLSDESRFTLFHLKGGAWVYHRPGKKLVDRSVQQLDHFGVESVMNCGRIPQRRTNLIFVDGFLNVVRYRRTISHISCQVYASDWTWLHFTTWPCSCMYMVFRQQQNIDVIPLPSNSLNSHGTIKGCIKQPCPIVTLTPKTNNWCKCLTNLIGGEAMS
jgi:hypothetical protein